MKPIADDRTSDIQKALDSIGDMAIKSDDFRGAVLLEADEYEIQGTLINRKSGVILLGLGDASIQVQFYEELGTYLFKEISLKLGIVNLIISILQKLEAQLILFRI